MKQLKTLTAAAFIAISAAGMANAASAPELKHVSYSAIPAGAYTLDKNHASLTWKVSHMGLSNYTARFTSFDSEVTLDPKDITKSKVTATINPASVETDFTATSEKDFNKNLSEKEEWFNSKKFPEIKFESTKIEKTGDTTGKIHGNLTFLGVKKAVVLDTVFIGALEKHPFSQKAVFGISAKTKLKRSDFGMTNYIPMIGDEVEVQIEAEYGQK